MAKWAKLATDYGTVYAWGEYRAYWEAGRWELEHDRRFVGQYMTLREAKAEAEEAANPTT